MAEKKTIFRIQLEESPTLAKVFFFSLCGKKERKKQNLKKRNQTKKNREKKIEKKRVEEMIISDFFFFYFLPF